MGEFFGGADGELAADDLVGGEQLGVLVLDREDRLGVADGEAALGDEQLHVAVEIEQAHGIGDAGAGFADAAGDFILLEREFLGEADVAGGFFHRVEVFALEVLDERHFEHIAVGRLAFDDRHGGEAEFAGGAPAAFAGDEFEFAIHRADDERLDDAVLADRLDEVVERGFAELGARLQRAGNHHVERHVADAFEILRSHRGIEDRRGHAFPDECSESFSECLFRHGAGSITQSRREFQADLPWTLNGADFRCRRAWWQPGHGVSASRFGRGVCLGVRAQIPEGRDPGAA